MKYCQARAQSRHTSFLAKAQPREKENALLPPSLRQKISLKMALYLDLLPSQNKLHLFTSNLRLKTRQEHSVVLQ